MNNQRAILHRYLCIGLACAGLAAASGCATLEPLAEDPADGGLRALVEQRLAVDPLTQQGMFRVDVDGGHVIIRGAVRSESERMRVLGQVRGTPGVSGVTDRLRLLP